MASPAHVIAAAVFCSLIVGWAVLAVWCGAHLEEL